MGQAGNGRRQESEKELTDISTAGGSNGGLPPLWLRHAVRARSHRGARKDRRARGGPSGPSASAGGACLHSRIVRARRLEICICRPPGETRDVDAAALRGLA